MTKGFVDRDQWPAWRKPRLVRRVIRQLCGPQWQRADSLLDFIRLRWLGVLELSDENLDDAGFAIGFLEHPRRSIKANRRWRIARVLRLLDVLERQNFITVDRRRWIPIATATQRQVWRVTYVDRKRESVDRVAPL